MEQSTQIFEMFQGKSKKPTESDSVAQEANTTTVKPPPVAAKSALKKSNSLVDSGVEKKKVVIQSPDPNDGLLKKQTISFMEDVPINILCLDGGGTKCYSTLAMMEEIEAISEREGIENRDFLSRFDLIVGTSIGGVLALIVNKTASTNDFIVQGREMLDQFLAMNCYAKEKSVNTSDQPVNVARRSFFDDNDISILDSTGLKACAVSSAWDSNSNRGAESQQPFLLRTYNVRANAQLDGTSDLGFPDAIHATFASPHVYDHIPISHQGKVLFLCDGAGPCKCPVALAIMEAKHLFPDRPLGIILSLGEDSKQDFFARRVIDREKEKSPGLSFYRIVPSMVVDNFSSHETGILMISKMECATKWFVGNNTRVRALLLDCIQKLFASGSRRPNVPERRQIDTLSRNRSLKILNSSLYQISNNVRKYEQIALNMNGHKINWND